MKNVFITGGAGFIGSNFVRHLLRAETGVRIVNLDALTYAGSLENLKDLPSADRHTFVHGNICDGGLVRELLEQHKIDTIVHFAAESHVDRSIADAAPFIQTNVVGTLCLLEAARARDARFHHVSTDEVYGSLGTNVPPFTETTPYAPHSPYAASKAASDHLVRAYAHTYRLRVTITNCSNNYGPFQFPEKLIPVVIQSVLARKPVPVYGDGMNVRDWLYVRDHAEALWIVLARGKPGETYNIGGHNEWANLRIVELICDIIDELKPDLGGNSRKLISFVTDRPGHDRRYAIDAAKIQRELGWTPAHRFEDGIRETVRWYLDNQAWVKAVSGNG
jgi:dTDP-glucose 4,6-dehydratase